MYLEASEGRLEIVSAPKKGTEVKLHIPYELTTHVPSRGKIIMDDADDYRKGEIGRPLTCAVLLVEDELVMQKIIVQRLVEMGYQVDVAKNGRDAIALAIANDYPIILLDITLPDINGLEVMKQIYALKGDNIIFIALSSHASEEEEDYFMRQGVMALLAKPVTHKQLKNMMDMALEVKARLEKN
jgi:CheY-like chemotaxis protein